MAPYLYYTGTRNVEFMLSTEHVYGIIFLFVVASSVEQLQGSFDVFRDDAECMTQLRRQMSCVLTDSLIAASQPVFDDARMTVYNRIKNPLIQQYYDEKKALSQLENI